jgi:hypothetical protein
MQIAEQGTQNGEVTAQHALRHFAVLSSLFDILHSL